MPSDANLPQAESYAMPDVDLKTTSLLALLTMQGVGRRSALRIVDLMQDSPRDGQSFWEMVRELSHQVRVHPASLSSSIDLWRHALLQMQEAADHRIRVIGFHEPAYPSRLRNIPDPPAVLFSRGDPSVLAAERVVALIGTREPSEFGRKSARKIGAALAESGVAVVSGLAHGCDAEGHWGCVEASGRGVAVLAHGLEKVYPAANRDLADRLLELGGCLVSEYPVGVSPGRKAFVERDRIQSGLSDAVLVVETGVTGGTMHTVRYAEEQRRELACIDHPAEWQRHEKAAGNRLLIREGRAVPIAKAEDLALFLRRLPLRRVRHESSANPAPSSSPIQGSLDF